MASIQPIGWDDDYEIVPGGCLDRGAENGGADAAIVLSSYDESDMYQCIIEVEKNEVVTIGNNQERPANVPPDIPETLSTGVIKYLATESTEVCDLINSTAPYYGIPIVYRFHKYEILYEEIEGDIPNWWKLKSTNRDVYTWILYFKCNDEPIAPPGWEWSDGNRLEPIVCDFCELEVSYKISDNGV